MPDQLRGSTSETRHTPGPWNALFDPDGRFEIECETHIIAACEPSRQRVDEYHANAHLIAAAPDMLAQLKRNRQGYLNLQEFHGINTEAAVAKIDAVIAKAEGTGN